MESSNKLLLKSISSKTLPIIPESPQNTLSSKSSLYRTTKPEQLPVPKLIIEVHKDKDNQVVLDMEVDSDDNYLDSPPTSPHHQILQHHLPPQSILPPSDTITQFHQLLQKKIQVKVKVK